MSALARIREILTYDIDPDFLRDVAITIVWEYCRLFDTLASDEAIPPEVKSEIFARRRGECAVRALVSSAKRHGVPYNFRKLECNGQHKIILKVGRIILIQETFSSLRDGPQSAEYKRTLANTHGLVRQLELDLGDQPWRILDWSGSIVGVLLHAPAGRGFSQQETMLGGLMLGVPNERYDSWLTRLDLTKLAMHGVSEVPEEEAPAAAPVGIQEDAVRVVLKSRKTSTGNAS